MTFPDCMIPDGGEGPCVGYLEMEAKLKRRMFLLHGWGRSLCYEADRRRDIDYIKKQRHYDGTETKHGGGWGIAVAEDEWAGLWQRIEFRIKRAHRAFNMDGLVTEHVWKDERGFVKTPDEEIKARNTKCFQENYRARAHAAKMRFNKPIRDKIDEASYEETMREAARDLY